MREGHQPQFRFYTKFNYKPVSVIKPNLLEKEDDDDIVKYLSSSVISYKLSFFILKIRWPSFVYLAERWQSVNWWHRSALLQQPETQNYHRKSDAKLVKKNQSDALSISTLFSVDIDQ